MVDSGCVARLDGPRCGLPPTSGLPICGACLRRMLDEDDPRHRRTLAGCEQLAAGVVQRLAEDPDEQVRARIGAREDLDAATTSRLANPDREPSPMVWRSIAATRSGAAHAWELLGSDDPATLAVLAANPLVDPDILDQLTRYPDPDVAWTASTALTGQPVRPPASDQITTALAVGGLSLDEPSDTGPETVSDPEAASGSETAAPPADPTEDPPRPSPPDAERHRHLGLLIGAVGLCVIAAVLVLVTYSRGRADHSSAVADPAITSTTHVPPATASTTASATASTSATTAVVTAPPGTTTPAPTLPPPPPASVPIVTPPPAGPVTQTLTISSNSGRFCQQVNVTVSFSPEPASVVVHDDAGFQIGAWTGPSGQSHNLPLASPTSTLQVTVTANGNGLSISGSANGPSC